MMYFVYPIPINRTIFCNS